VYNGRNISDNTLIKGKSLRNDGKENSKPGIWDNGIITQNILDFHYSDTSDIKFSKNPSNLVEAPRINEKYEFNS
jgi:hypothetical protein